MLPKQKLMKLLLTCFLFALCPLLASATVVTGGTITTSGPFNLADFNFSGSGFSVSGQFLDYGGWANCTPCIPGVKLDVNGSVVGNDFLNGSGTVGTTSFDPVYYGDMDQAYPGSSVFNVSGPAITLAGPGTYYSTFSFNGSLCGTNGGPEFAHPCLVNLPGLTGSGIVEATATLENGYLYVRNAVYTFTATPEPRTWMLALIGILPLLAWRLKMA